MVSPPPSAAVIMSSFEQCLCYISDYLHYVSYLHFRVLTWHFESPVCLYSNAHDDDDDDAFSSSDSC